MATHSSDKHSMVWGLSTKTFSRSEIFLINKNSDSTFSGRLRPTISFAQVNAAAPSSIDCSSVNCANFKIVSITRGVFTVVNGTQVISELNISKHELQICKLRLSNLPQCTKKSAFADLVAGEIGDGYGDAEWNGRFLDSRTGEQSGAFVSDGDTSSRSNVEDKICVSIDTIDGACASNTCFNSSFRLASTFSLFDMNSSQAVLSKDSPNVNENGSFASEYAS